MPSLGSWSHQLTFVGGVGTSQEVVGDVVEHREVTRVLEDALGFLRLQQLQDRGRGHIPKFHLDGMQVRAQSSRDTREQGGKTKGEP